MAMTEHGEERRPKDSEDSPFRFPEGEYADQSAEQDEDEEPLAALCSVPVSEADAVCARLESEGIPCEPDVQGAADTPTAPSQSITILVREIDLDVAREALSRPKQTDERAEDFDDHFYILPRHMCSLSQRWTRTGSAFATLAAIPVSMRSDVGHAHPAQHCGQRPSQGMGQGS